VAKRGVRDHATEGTPNLHLGVGISLRFGIPSDAGERVAFARFLWDHLGAPTPECLVWVANRSIWPSGEHLPLFNRWREALGAHSSIDDAPGMLFRIGEEDDALSALLWPFLFLWDAYFIPADGQSLLELSHDEWGILSFKHSGTADALADGFRFFELRVEELAPVAG
jgi:hypothetical protein